MFEITLSDGLIISIILATLLIYLLIGLRDLRHTNKFVSFFMDDFNLKGSSFLATISATNIPLANGLLFYITLGYYYGAYTLIMIPAIMAMFWVFIYFMKFLDYPISQGITLHEYLGTAFNSRGLRLAAAGVTCFTFLVGLSFEAFIGVEIFSVFFDITNPVVKLGLAVVFILLLSIYSSLGGFKTVVNTDVVQVFLISLGLIFALVFIFGGGNRISPSSFMGYRTFPGWLFIITSSIFYIAWTPSSMDTWQRCAATKNVTLSQNMMKVAAIVIGFVYIVPICIGAYVALNNLGSDSNPVIPFTQTIYANKSLFWTIGLAIFFSGLIASMISTADTYLAVLGQAVVADIYCAKKGVHYLRLDEKLEIKMLRITRIVIAIFPAIFLIASWYLLVVVIKLDIPTLFYASFASQVALFPMVLFATQSVKLTNASKESGAALTVVPSKGLWLFHKNRLYGKAATGAVLVGFASTMLSIGISIIADSLTWLYLSPVVTLFTSYLSYELFSIVSLTKKK